MPSTPASMRIQPTTSRFTPETLTFSAKVRIAPSASRTMTFRAACHYIFAPGAGVASGHPDRRRAPRRKCPPRPAQPPTCADPPSGCPGGLRRRLAQDCVIARCRGPLSTTVVAVTRDDERERHDADYTNPALDAELAYRREVLRPPEGHPQPARRLVPQPPSAALTPTASAAGRSCRRSVPRSTTCHAGTTPRWWAGPTSSAACWRTSSGRSAAAARRCCWPATPESARPGCSRSSAPRDRGRRPGARSGTASTSARSGCPICPSSTCCARSRRTGSRPELVGEPGARGAARRRGPAPPPVSPASEGRDLGRPLPHRAAPQPVDDGRLQLFESVAGLLCELAPRPAADRARGRALGRPVQPRPAALPAGPAGRRAGGRGRLLPRRRPAPASPAAPAAGRAGAAARRRADRAGAAAGRRRRRAGPRPGRETAGCRSRPWTTSSPAPRATPSTPRSCWPPGCTARRCRSG